MGTQKVSNPFERATAFFLFGSLQQFYFDGNQRTSRAMMNGVLMTQGLDAVSIPAVRATEFNSRMIDFYTSLDATEMMAFVFDCILKFRRSVGLILGFPPSGTYQTSSTSVSATR